MRRSQANMAELRDDGARNIPGLANAEALIETDAIGGQMYAIVSCCAYGT